MEKSLNYLSKNFNEIRNELIRFARLYYPTIVNDFSDAAIASFLIDLNAGVGDDLSYHIDRAFQETQIDYAQERRSLLSIARTKGLKIQGKKASMVEVELSCDVPMSTNYEPDVNYLPIIRTGTKASTGSRVFELVNDVDFSSQFDKNGISNRQIIPKRDSNANIIGYTIKKLEVMEGSETKFFTKTINDSDVRPFMEIVLPDTNVISVESIIFKEGVDYKYRPSTQDFMANTEYLSTNQSKDGRPTWRFFEVENLIENKIFTDVLTVDPANFPTPIIDEISLGTGDSKYWVSIYKGMWKYITQKFITEYTDKGYMKIIFGAGSDYNYPETSDYQKKQMSKIINNMNLGILPKPGWTMNIMYRTGGGYATNIAENTLRSLIYKEVDIKGDSSNPNDFSIKNSVEKSLKINNISPSMSGRDEPSNDELRYMIKYNNQAQNRVVLINDYYDRIYKIPNRFGAPYRVGVSEANNIINVSVLGVDGNNNLTNNISQALIDNMSNYLAEYQHFGTYTLVKPGRVYNLQVECDLMIDKKFNKNDVMLDVIEKIKDFFNIENRQMGDPIYTSELTQEIMSINGVINLISMKIYNIFGSDYSNSKVKQKIVSGSWDSNGNWVINDTIAENRVEIDLVDSDGILFTEKDAMFEVKKPNNDVKLRIKTN